MLETSTQARMAVQKNLPGRFKGLLIERSLETEHELGRIDVRPLNVIEGMEQQALLQRRERQNVLKVRILEFHAQSRPGKGEQALDPMACDRRIRFAQHGGPESP